MLTPAFLSPSPPLFSISSHSPFKFLVCDWPRKWKSCLHIGEKSLQPYESVQRNTRKKKEQVNSNLTKPQGHTHELSPASFLLPHFHSSLERSRALHLKCLPDCSDSKNQPAMQETQVHCLDQEDPLEKEIATHSGILAWKIPWTEEPGRLQSMGSQSQHNWATNTNTTRKQKEEYWEVIFLCKNIYIHFILKSAMGR